MLNNGIFSPEELEILKKREEPLANALFSEVMDTARMARRNGGAPELLAFGYHMTGDDGYVEQARGQMQALADKPVWYSEEYSPTAYEGYDIRTALETGGNCFAMSYLLSFFGDRISEDERDAFILALLEKGIYPILEDWVLPGHRIHALDTMGHNFWITTISGCAAAITLLYDHLPDYKGLTADDMLNAARDAVRAWFAYPGNPLNAKPANIDRGGYYESVTYFDFSLHEYLRFAFAYKRRFGEPPFDDTELLMQAADFFLNASYPSSKKDYAVGFGDTSGAEFLYAPLHMLRYGLDHPDLRYYEQHLHNIDPDKLLRLLLWDEIYQKPAEPHAPLSACYTGIGWAMFKSTNAPDGDMLCIKCGDTWNHAHADAGHFTLFRRGVPEVFDALMTSYSSPRYIPYFTDSHAHNVLLYNGQGQDFRDNYKNHAHLPGKLYNYMDEDGFRYVVADATGPMSRYFRKHHRHFVWLDGFILIYDDVECYDCGTVSYLLHAADHSCHRMLTFCDVTVGTGYVSDRAEKHEFERTYFSFNRQTDDEGHVRFAALLLLDDTLSYAFEENTPNWVLNIGEYTLYFNYRADGKVMHRNALVTVDGFLTDALLLILKNSEPYAVVNGSIVRKKDPGTGETASYLETLSRITGKL